MNLALMTQAIERAAPRLEDRPVDPDLCRARVADICRDQDLDPLPPDDFDAMTAGLDAEGWRRLALLIQIERWEYFLEPFGPAIIVELGLISLARDATLLTMAVLRASEVRREELARHFAERLGAALNGETAEQSRAALQKIDYARLISQTERAREEAQKRLEALDELARRNAPRGKW